MTDMTHDDGYSLIRYLHYAASFDTDAIIVAPQLPDYGHDAEAPWQKTQAILQTELVPYRRVILTQAEAAAGERVSE